jgi:hypothetical protein
MTWKKQLDALNETLAGKNESGKGSRQLSLWSCVPLNVKNIKFADLELWLIDFPS